MFNRGIFLCDMVLNACRYKSRKDQTEIEKQFKKPIAPEGQNNNGKFSFLGIKPLFRVLHLSKENK
jgi:hypothetical protein